VLVVEEVALVVLEEMLLQTLELLAVMVLHLQYQVHLFSMQVAVEVDLKVVLLVLEDQAAVVPEAE
jgi:hypothetical protein